MTDYTLSVALKAEKGAFSPVFRQAQNEVRGLGKVIGAQSRTWATSFAAAGKSVTMYGKQVARFVRDNQQGVESLGRGFITFGAAAALGLGFAAKAAIEWETAWAGVVKTTDASADALPGLEKSLRALTGELPASHQEIAAVAEAAGQLGIKSKDVVGFTKVMVAMGVSTNLTSDQAATSIAQMMNIMQTAPENVTRLASTIVSLGNSGASTEAQIVDMALRVSGAGHQIGLTEAEVLSFASAMASVGLSTELGGSAISRVFVMMSDAVNKGGADLEAFAKISNMSAAEFAKAFKETPAQAVDAFIVGLGKISDSGGDVFAALENVGIKSVEMRDVVLRLAGAGSLLTENLEQGNDAWARNTALMDEASKRYETTASRIQIAQNQINELGIEIGSVLLPAIADAAGGVADLASWFANLSDPMKEAVVTLGGIVGGLSLASGAILLMLPRIVEFAAAWKSLPPSITAANGRLATFSKAAIGVTAIVLAFQALGSATEDVPPNLSEIANRLREINEEGGDVGELFAGIEKEWYSASQSGFSPLKEPKTEDDWKALLDYIEGASSGFGKMQADVAGLLRLDGDFKDYTTTLATTGEVLAELSATDLTGAQQQFKAFVDAAGGGDEVTRQLIATMPAYEDSLYSLAEAQGMALNETSLLALATGEMQIASQSAEAAAKAQETATADAAAAVGMSVEQYEAAVKAVNELRGSMDDASNSFIDISGTYTSLYDEQAAKANEAKGVESQAWYDMVGNVKISISEYIGELEKQAEAQANWQSNLLSLTDNLSSATISYLQSLGPEGAALVQQLTEASTGELKKFDALTQETMGGASQGWVLQMEQGMALVQAVLAEQGPEAAATLADALASGGTTVEAAAQALGAKITESVPGEWSITFDANAAPAEAVLHNVKVKVDKTEGTVSILGKDGKARSTLSNYKRTVDKTTGAVTIEGEDEDGRRQVITFKDWVNGQTTQVGVSVDLSVAQQQLSAFRAQAVVRAQIDDGRNRPGMYLGGLMGFAGGGEVPGQEPSNPREDNVLGVDGAGVPRYRIRSGEFVQSTPAVRHYGVGIMDAINNRQISKEALLGALPGLARGGALQSTATELARARRALLRARDHYRRPQSERSKAASQRRLDAAEGRYDRAQAERATAIEESRTLKSDIARGNIRDSVTSGRDSALSVVDRMRNLARDPALTGSQEHRLLQSANSAGKRIHSMYRAADLVAESLEKARDRAQELSQIKGGVVDALTGEQKIGSILGQKNEFGFDKPVTAATILENARARVVKIRGFAVKMRRLQELGYSGTILQEIASLGSEEGTQVADALIAGGKGTASQLNEFYRQTDVWAGKAGQVVTEGFYKGGLSAADGLVKGLENKEKAIQNAMIRLAKSMETALKKALGIRSPARKPMEWMEPMGDGFVIGIDNQQEKIDKAMNRLVTAPSGGFSAGSVAGSTGIAGISSTDQALLGQIVQEMRAANDRPITLNVNRRQVGTLFREGRAASETLA